MNVADHISKVRSGPPGAFVMPPAKPPTTRPYPPHHRSDRNVLAGQCLEGPFDLPTKTTAPRLPHYRTSSAAKADGGHYLGDSVVQLAVGTAPVSRSTPLGYY
jgi:hypothetical protein